MVSTHLKHIKLNHFPKVRGENKKYLKPPPSCLFLCEAPLFKLTTWTWFLSYKSQRLGFHLDWILGCGGFHDRSICATAGGNFRWLWCFQGHGDVGHGCAGGTSKISPVELPKWQKLGELATHPGKNTQTNTNSSNKIWTMSKSSVENIREQFSNPSAVKSTHLACFLIWKLCWKNQPDSTVFLNVQRKREIWHSWTIVKFSWITFFVAKRFTKEISNTQPTNQRRNKK